MINKCHYKLSWFQFHQVTVTESLEVSRKDEHDALRNSKQKQL